MKNIVPIDNLLSVDLDALITDSLREGYGMVNRLKNDYEAGTNTFSKEGENLYGYFNNQILAIGGINIESDLICKNAGRIRRVYVHPSIRGTGIGKMLLAQIMKDASQYFKYLTCNVGPLKSYGFYESIGFEKANQETITHIYKFV
jgi:GNAT superfamily N-acetyltransferase